MCFCKVQLNLSVKGDITLAIYESFERGDLRKRRIIAQNKLANRQCDIAINVGPD